MHTAIAMPVGMFTSATRRISKVSLLFCMIANITLSLEKGKIVIMILMDLSCAFDCIPYRLFISKLRAYGLSINACNCIPNYYLKRVITSRSRL